MAKIDDSKDLEKALSKNEQKISKEQEIAFINGVLNTLVAERNELIKMIGNVEMIMQSHIKRLEELGIKIQKK